jgi:two-component system OmpR family sensor kinase
MELADPDLQRFAAAIVHELRTPLAALSAEVELALRRERPAAAYRDAVMRIAEIVEELFDHTRDLAALADAYDPEVVQLATASLGGSVKIVGRYPPGTVSVGLGDDAVSGRVIGDESLLGRAIALLIDHAVRQRADDGVVRLRTLPGIGGPSFVLVIDAVPALPADVWRPLAGEGPETPTQAAALRLRAATNMIRACGGSVICAPGSTALRIELRRALP